MTILDSLIENAGPRFQRTFADEALLERLRVCATDSLSDPEVRKKCQVVFRQWAVAYSATSGMERVVALQKQLPKRKKPVTQQQSKVLRETEPHPDEDPFSTADDEKDNRKRSVSSATPNTYASSSTMIPTTSSNATSYHRKKLKSEKPSKRSRHKGFNLEKEKPQILQAIASSSIASTNLMNALKLIDRERKRVSEDIDAVAKFEVCKQLRRQILRYIQHIESEQWLGSLIHANDNLIEALMAFEILDKSVEDDSDSEGIVWSDSEDVASSKPAATGQRSMPDDFAGLTIAHKTQGPPSNMHINSKEPSQGDEESSSEGIVEDENDPFADSHAYS